MDIDKSELLTAATKSGLSKSQAEELWKKLSEKKPISSKFDLSRLLYYFGAMVVIIAMGWFVDIAWERFGGGGIFAIALAYMISFFAAGNFLWNKEGLRVPGGLFITMAVSLIPLAVYGFQKWTGWWITDEPGEYKDFVSWVRGGWFFMEIATIIGGCIALWFYRFPFLTMPIFFSLWFMSMDITPLLFKEDLWTNRLWVSIGFGIVILIVAYITDLKSSDDFAFWGYLFGMFAFWTGLSLLESSNEFERFLYCLINVFLVLLSVFLQRSVFLIFGSVGILIYFSSLFYRYFSDSAWFPILLSLMGLVIILTGIWFHKNRTKIDAFILNLLPKGFDRFRPNSKKGSLL